MKIKPWESEQKYEDPIKQVLANRGIPDPDEWLGVKPGQWADPEKLETPRGDLREAVKVVVRAIEEKTPACILVDCDADGFTSSAILLNYLFEVDEEYAKSIVPLFHTGKQHGLADVIDSILENNYKLVLVPDAGSNDYDEHRKIKEAGGVVIVLDHHEAPHLSEDALTINNQLCGYRNKALSGAGVTWQFCRMLDKEYETDHANKFLDIAALGCLSDMMDFRSLETKSIIIAGLADVRNPFFYAMKEKNSYSMGGKVNYISCAFYVTPIINSVMRSGSMDEKDLLFKSMLTFCAFEQIPSEKRGERGILTDLVNEAVRVATNVKARQTKSQEAMLAYFETLIREKNMLEHPYLLFLVGSDKVEPNLAGLIANKLMAKYQRPCMILRDTKFAEDDEHYFRGSLRNYQWNDIDDFRALCEQGPGVEYAQGHSSAAGLSVAASKTAEFANYLDQELKDVEPEPVYLVDFVNPDLKLIRRLGSYPDIWGQNVPEPFVYLEHSVEPFQVQLLSADKNPTIKITLDSGLVLMKFKSSREEYEDLTGNGAFIIKVIGKSNLNEWNGKITVQMILEDYEVEQKEAEYIW